VEDNKMLTTNYTYGHSRPSKTVFWMAEKKYKSRKLGKDEKDVLERIGLSCMYLYVCM
jgi:hypothetical protein